MPLLRPLLDSNNGLQNISKTVIDDYTIEIGDFGNRLLVDGSNNNITITTPEVETAFLNKPDIEIDRADCPIGDSRGT